MKFLTDKKYYELTAKIDEQEKELELLKVERDLDEQTRIHIGKVNIDLRNEVLKLRHNISELAPIIEKFNHKKRLEKARKQKYRLKLRLQKKEAVKTDAHAIEMSEAEKFARENAGKEIRHRTHVGYIVGYNIKEDVENEHVLIGFKDGYGWHKTALTENDVFVVDTPTEEYETYWYFGVEEIILKIVKTNEKQQKQSSICNACN